jgi:hypothetical protein
MHGGYVEVDNHSKLNIEKQLLRRCFAQINNRSKRNILQITDAQ